MSLHHPVMRQTTPSDLEDLLDMMKIFNEEEMIPWSREQAREPLKKLLSDQSLGVGTILEAGGKPAGYGLLTWGFDLEWSGRDAFLTELYIEEAWRGKGLGRALLEHTTETAR